MPRQLKETLSTFNDKVAEFFSSRGVRTLVLYEADGVRCYKVTLRGRAQLRLLEHEDYLPLATGAVLDPQRVIIARTTPPLYTITKNGTPIVVAGPEGTDVLAFGRNGDFLESIVTPPGYSPVGGGPLPFPGDLELLRINTWEQLHAILLSAQEDGIKAVRFFIGWGNGNLPFQETYPIALPIAVTTAAVAKLQKQPEEPGTKP